MEDTLTKVVVNCSTGETTTVTLTPQEVAQAQADSAAFAARKAAEEEAASTREALKASAKAKLIAGQPLTAEEAEVLVL